MRHLKSGRGLGVDPSHRIALLRSLTLAIIEHDSIRTTRARAKELRWYAERVVTLAKRGDVAARRHIIKLLGSAQTSVPGENRVRNAVARIYSDLAPRFKTRPGGYTQILHLVDRRPGDNAEMCLIRYIPPAEEAKGGKKAKGEKSEKKVEAKSDKSSKKEAKDVKKAKADAPKEDKAEKKADKGPEDKHAKSKKKSDK